MAHDLPLSESTLVASQCISMFSKLLDGLKIVENSTSKFICYTEIRLEHVCTQ